MKNNSHNGSGKAANSNLSIAEFRFMQEALRGGVFDTHSLSCGCIRRQHMLDETLSKFREHEIDPDDFGVDLATVVNKLSSMDGTQTAKLIENVNHCYFAEVMRVVECHEADDDEDWDDDDLDYLDDDDEDDDLIV